MTFLDHIWLIPILPIASALIQLLFGRRLSNRSVSVISVGLPAAACAWAIGCFAELLSVPDHTFLKTIYTWLPLGPYHMSAASGGGLAQLTINAGFQLDPLSAVMLMIVTGVGFLIHFYSIGYMAHEGGYYRFFGYMNLFLFSMLILILADNYLMMFVGWEGVGLCSYLLIGFFFQKRSAADAGKKAFIANRIGDAGFLLGTMLMVVTFGTVNFHDVTALARSGHFAVGNGVVTAICILLFVGATGKSAQIPLYVWLPDAMEGPTPVSALIHAATMVTAGVYMVARSNALFVLAPVTLEIVAVIGAATAIWAASMALAQTDIKKVLAYSTISQLGYMFLACGVGAFAAGIFHLMTHAFFKALLFLGAGSVIHALGGEQDMRRMGALRKKIPITFVTLLAATLAISGIPGFAGFFSKDEILWGAFSSRPYGSEALWAVGWITAGLTAFYMFRLLFLTFFGQSRVEHEAEHHIHEAPFTMASVLVVLAVLSVVGGYINWPLARFGAFLEPVFANDFAARHAAEFPHSLELELMALSVGIALLGLGVAYVKYVKRDEVPRPVGAALNPVHQLVLNKYYVDELYDAVFVNRVKNVGNAAAAFDAIVVDGGVNAAGWLTRRSGDASRFWDKWVIDGAVNVLGFGTKLLSYPVRVIQTGLFQTYAFFIVLGVLVLMGYYLVHF